MSPHRSDAGRGQAAETVLRKQAKPVRTAAARHRARRAPRLPEIVQIESTNICNAKCVFCPRDEMHARQGIMDMATLPQDRRRVRRARHHARARCTTTASRSSIAQLVEKVRYAKQKGIQEVGMISNGSLITEDGRARHDRGRARRHQHQRRRGRQGGLRVDARRPQVRQGHRQHRAAGPDPRRARQAPAEADSVVRPPEQLGRRAGVHRALARRSPTRSTSPTCTTGPARSTSESDVNYPCYRPWLTFTVLWDGRVSLCCADFDGRDDPRRSPHLARSRRSGTPSPTARCAAQHLEQRRPRHLPVVRPAEEGLPALGPKAHLTLRSRVHRFREAECLRPSRRRRAAPAIARFRSSAAVSPAKRCNSALRRLTRRNTVLPAGGRLASVGPVTTPGDRLRWESRRPMVASRFITAAAALDLCASLRPCPPPAMPKPPVRARPSRPAALAWPGGGATAGRRLRPGQRHLPRRLRPADARTIRQRRRRDPRRQQFDLSTSPAYNQTPRVAYGNGMFLVDVARRPQRSARRRRLGLRPPRQLRRRRRADLRRAATS